MFRRLRGTRRIDAPLVGVRPDHPSRQGYPAALPMLVHPIVEWKEIGNDVDLMRSRVRETEPNSDGFALCVSALGRFGLQFEAVVTGPILASVHWNTAKDKAEERYECLSHAKTVRGIECLV